MVYRGKPSPGCGLCRARRLKCDQVRPSCSQCLRKKKQCPGYQDLSILRLHDQSQEVITKARAKEKMGNHVSSRTLNRELSYPNPRSIPSSQDERAFAYVFKYSVGTEHNRGALYFLHDILKSNPTTTLVSSIRAYGLAAISLIQNSSEGLITAREEYNVAVRAVRDDLHNPAVFKSDSTLASVMFLSTYELTTATVLNSIATHFLNHVNGAVKLIELRGVEQLKTSIGMELFNVIRIQNATSNIFWQRRSLVAILDLSKEPTYYKDTRLENISRLASIMIKTAEFSAEIGELSQADTLPNNALDLMQTALELDRELVAWAGSLEDNWGYEIMDANGPDFNDENGYPCKAPSLAALGRCHHVYPAVDVVSAWNNYRQTRIILQEVMKSMAGHILGLGGSAAPEQIISYATATAMQMAEDICSSVPYFFQSGEAAIGSTMRLLYPLTVASYCVGSDTGVKDWILETFRTIRQVCGNEQTKVVARMLESNSVSDLIPQ